jgi:hypothetical protein
MKTKFKTAKELMKKPYLRREDFPDDLWTAVENYHVAIAVLDACREKYDDIPQDHRIAVENYFVADTVLDQYREKYGDDLVDLAIDCGSPRDGKRVSHSKNRSHSPKDCGFILFGETYRSWT